MYNGFATRFSTAKANCIKECITWRLILRPSW